MKILNKLFLSGALCLAAFFVAGQAADTELSTKQSLSITIKQILTVSEQWQLDPALLLAIVDVESNFNPKAISHANAIGLMQVVPRTAGEDVTKSVAGVAKEIPEAYLLEPEKNLMVGSNYLHQLEHQYLYFIKEPDKKRLLIIAAYNGGIGTLYKLFSRNKSVFSATIVAMSYEELFDKLTETHPFEETRHYVTKVEAKYFSYKNFIDSR